MIQNNLEQTHLTKPIQILYLPLIYPILGKYYLDKYLDFIYQVKFP